MFLSFKDLENDFFNSSLNSEIKDFFSGIDETEIITGMQKRKATFMFNFLKMNTKSLSKLKDDNISKPLLECKSKIELIQDETD